MHDSRPEEEERLLRVPLPQQPQHLRREQRVLEHAALARGGLLRVRAGGAVREVLLHRGSLLSGRREDRSSSHRDPDTREADGSVRGWRTVAGPSKVPLLRQRSRIGRPAQLSCCCDQ